MQVIIKEASACDAQKLTEIAFKSKRTWHYPKEYFDTWKNELTIHDFYIRDNCVFRAQVKSDVVGFYSIVENPKTFYSGDVLVEKGFWLEHIFILPEFQKQNIGRIMIEHAKYYCLENNIGVLLIFSDPNASGFYEKIGAEFKYMSESSIKNRKIPVFVLYI